MSRPQAVRRLSWRAAHLRALARLALALATATAVYATGLLVLDVAATAARAGA